MAMRLFPRVLAAGVLAASAVLLLGVSDTSGADDPAKEKAKAKAKKKKAEPPDTAAMFTKLDTNSDGKLDLDEFKNLFTVMAMPKGKKGQPADPVDLEFVFKSLDANGDKTLSMEEFKGVIAAVSPPKK
jgi:hypothetical protein